MDTLNIHNWERWQSYRADRGQPPWIKIHREVMRCVEWVSLTDAQRGQLVAIWLLAADRNGVIPASAKIIQKLCHLDTEPNIKLFIEQGFIDSPQIDVNMTPTSRQNDQPETETETETETDVIKKPSRKKNKTTIPNDFGISDNVANWALENGFKKLDLRLTHFKNVCQAKGYEYADWDAAFRNAISSDWAKLGKDEVKGKFDLDEFMRSKL